MPPCGRRCSAAKSHPPRCDPTDCSVPRLPWHRHPGNILTTWGLYRQPRYPCNLLLNLFVIVFRGCSWSFSFPGTSRDSWNSDQAVSPYNWTNTFIWQRLLCHAHTLEHPKSLIVAALLTCELLGDGLPRDSDFAPFPCYGRESLNAATPILPVASVGHTFVWFSFSFALKLPWVLESELICSLFVSTI